MFSDKSLIYILKQVQSTDTILTSFFQRAAKGFCGVPIKRTKKALQKRIAAIAVFPPVQEIDGGRRASGHFRPPPTAAFILRVCSSFNFHSPEFLHFSKFSNIPNLIQSPILSLRQLGGISSSLLKQRTLGRHFRSRNHALCATAPASNSCNAIARSLSLCSGRHPTLLFRPHIGQVISGARNS